MPLGTGGEFVGSPGGTGLLVPKGLVVGGPSSTPATIEIPGLNGSPDIIVPAGSGNSQYNDEFDQDGSGVPAGWTSFNSPAAVDTNTVLSHLHINGTNTADLFMGVYKAIAPTFPLTVTAKLADCSMFGANQAFFIGLSPVAPGTAGTALTTAIAFNATVSFVSQWLSFNSSTGAHIGSANGVLASPPGYLRAKLTTATSYQAQISKGMAWANVGSAQVIVSPLFVFLGVSGFGQTDNEVFFDWIRFS